MMSNGLFSRLLPRTKSADGWTRSCSIPPSLRMRRRNCKFQSTSSKADRDAKLELRYSSLQRIGEAQELAAKHDLTIIKPLTDEQLRAATAALTKSTAAIEEHARTLQEQHNALKELQTKNRQESEARAQAAGRKSKEYVAERQRLAQDVSGRRRLEIHLDVTDTRLDRRSCRRTRRRLGCVSESHQGSRSGSEGVYHGFAQEG